MSGIGGGAKRPQRDLGRRVLDDATRMRRARKALESLEQDNFHDDPHANLVMSKKALSLFQDDGKVDGEEKKARRKTRTSEYYKQRYEIHSMVSYKAFGNYLCQL